MVMSHVSVANKYLCPLSNLRKDNVACHYRFTPSCRVTKAPCRMSNLRNSHVAVSNLVVQTHLFVSLGRSNQLINELFPDCIKVMLFARCFMLCRVCDHIFQMRRYVTGPLSTPPSHIILTPGKQIGFNHGSHFILSAKQAATTSTILKIFRTILLSNLTSQGGHSNLEYSISYYEEGKPPMEKRH